MKSLSRIPKLKSIVNGLPYFNRKEDNFRDFYTLLAKYANKESSRKLLSIILPLYNEENTIGNVLNSLPKGDCIEIIVVNDNSSDASLSEISKVFNKDGLIILNHRKNLGYGAAIATGIKRAIGKVIVTMDSDGQHDPCDLITLITPVLENKVDFTIGSRYLGAYYSKLPLTTRLGEVLIEKLITLIYGTRIQNNQNGFRAFNRKLIPVISKFKYRGFAFCTEFIIKAKLEGYRIKECPIRVHDRRYGSSKIKLNKLIISLFTCIFKYSFKKRKKLIFPQFEDFSPQNFNNSMNKNSLTKSSYYSKQVNILDFILVNPGINLYINR